MYHDIQMKRMELLRNIYAASGSSIRPKTKVSKTEALKEIIRAWGMNPEQILTKEALAKGATAHINTAARENHQLLVLSNTLHELVRQEATGKIRSTGGAHTQIKLKIPRSTIARAQFGVDLSFLVEEVDDDGGEDG